MSPLLANLLEGVGVFGGVIGLLATVFWIWMLVDCLINPRLQGTEKIVWVLVVLFLNLLGAILYFFIGRGRTSLR